MQFMMGSFQDLLRGATAGILNRSYMNPAIVSASSNVGMWGLCPEAFGSNRDVSMPEEAECDDGYFGGEGLDDDDDDDDDDADDDEGSDGTIVSGDDGIPWISESINRNLPKQAEGMTRKKPPVNSDIVRHGFGPLPDDCFGNISDDEQTCNVEVIVGETDSEDGIEKNNISETMDVGISETSSLFEGKQMSGGNLFGDCGCVSGHKCDEDSDDEEETNDEEEFTLVDSEL
jgi:hypothetical protein